MSSIISISISLQTPNFIILFYGPQRIRSFLISTQGANRLFNESGSSYFNNKNPTSTISTSSHGCSQKLDKNSKQNRWMWFYTLHSIPLFPKSLELPLSSRYSLLKMTTLHTHIKTPKLSKMMLPQQPILKSLIHLSFPLCWSLKMKMLDLLISSWRSWHIGRSSIKMYERKKFRSTSTPN
jgi:hypothetical protein